MHSKVCMGQMSHIHVYDISPLCEGCGYARLQSTSTRVHEQSVYLTSIPLLFYKTRVSDLLC